jgi:hypothetical protein
MDPMQPHLIDGHVCQQREECPAVGSIEGVQQPRDASVGLDSAHPAQDAKPVYLPCMA